jgi:hypothetical protein
MQPVVQQQHWLTDLAVIVRVLRPDRCCGSLLWLWRTATKLQLNARTLQHTHPANHERPRRMFAMKRGCNVNYMHGLEQVSQYPHANMSKPWMPIGLEGR